MVAHSGRSSLAQPIGPSESMPVVRHDEGAESQMPPRRVPLVLRGSLSESLRGHSFCMEHRHPNPAWL